MTSYTKVGAINVLIQDVCSGRKSTRSSWLRCVKACEALGLSTEERVELMSGWFFRYIDTKTKTLYPCYEEKSKP